jgi:hypothetical protein
MNPTISYPELYSMLLQIDQDLAAETRLKGCPYCGGILHSACYPRKLEGPCVPQDSKANVRFSFCCSNDGCRRRVTPPSVRFLGRKRYLSAVVILVGTNVAWVDPGTGQEAEGTDRSKPQNSFSLA